MKKFADNFLLIFLTVVIFVILIILLSFFVEELLLPPDYLFYEHTPLFSLLIAPLLVIASFVASDLLLYGFKKKLFRAAEDSYHILWLGKKLGKWSVAVAAVWVILIYAAFTSLTYVTRNQIVIVTPFDLQGREYSYSDVARREVGFGNKKLSLYEHEAEGSFYYKLFLDGGEVVFHMPNTNPDIDRFEDTYLELEEFDAALNKRNIPKTSSADGFEKCDFDKRYVDRFLRIIESNVHE